MRFGPAVLVPLLLLSTAALAAPPDVPEELRGRTLRVGTRHVPPFAIRGEDGTWSGVSIELWKRVAGDLGLKYELVPLGLQEALDGIREGKLDAAAAAYTITGEREETLDFSTAFHVTGLAIATTPQSGGGGVLGIALALLTGPFWGAVGVLVGVIFVVGFVLWLLERRRNAAQFGGDPVKGLGNAFWWSAVTMTTVGYGDKAPTTFFGRLVAVVWMFVAILVISSLTASIATTLTVERLESAVSGPQDLPKVTVGSVRGSTGSRYLAARRIGHREYETAEEGLQALADRRVQAFVYDAPILRYLVKSADPDDVIVLPGTFQAQSYALVLPQGSELREPLNVAVARLVESSDWSDILRRYLGDG
jgi:polar amino acid transport system substrate-binding protein